MNHPEGHRVVKVKYEYIDWEVTRVLYTPAKPATEIDSPEPEELSYNEILLEGSLVDLSGLLDAGHVEGIEEAVLQQLRGI